MFTVNILCFFGKFLYDKIHLRQGRLQNNISVRPKIILHYIFIRLHNKYNSKCDIKKRLVVLFQFLYNNRKMYPAVKTLICLFFHPF